MRFRDSVPTRSLRGARCAWTAAGAALLLAGLAASALAREERGPGPLPWRLGYEVGFCADAASFPDSVGSELELFLRIRPSLIADLCRDGQQPTPIHVSASLRPLFGGAATDRELDVRVSPADTAGALGEVAVLRFPARPGRHRLSIRMEARRRQLARKGIQGPEVAKVEGEIVVPSPQAGRQISDIEFVWADADPGSARVFGSEGHDRIPNPERMYGLYANRLRALFTAKADAARGWSWVARATDSSGVVVAEQQGTAPAAPTMQADIGMDVSGLPAGAYDLEVKAWQEGDPGALLRRSRFSIAWQTETWTLDPQEIADNVHFLFSSDEEENFPRLGPGEQERALDRFWKERDPTPETAANERRTEFLQRVRFANRTYGRYGLGRGMFSDMGRVFIRYGEPEEVVRQVMPGLDDNLTRIIYDLARTERRSLGSVESREIGADMRPFELWTYFGNIPLPIDADPHQPIDTSAHKRLVFLFVDERWLGDYRLLYSGE